MFKAVHQANDQNATEFCIDFDKVVSWCGYTRKDSAKAALEKTCEKDVDFIISMQTRKTPFSIDANDLNGAILNKGGRPSEHIILFLLLQQSHACAMLILFDFD